MNKMTGIILMVVGALILGAGIFVYSTSSKDNNEKETAVNNEVVDTSTVESTIEENDTEDVSLDYKNGLNFEKFVVKKFSSKYFKVKEWVGDKSVEGVYAATNRNPDLLMEFIGFKQNKEFAVECKWRQKLYKNGLSFSNSQQLDRYRDYASKKGVSVFMALGLGGTGASPEKLFVVPLADISKPFMHINELKKYEKEMKTNFFYDYEKEELR